MSAPTSWATTALVASLVMALWTSACGLGRDGSVGGDGQRPGAADGRTQVGVLEVIDGDTIKVELEGSSTLVRLIGIDTPERDGPYTRDECFGAEASRYTERALDSRTVDLEFDVDRTDRFDRTLAYVWIEGTLFNERILVDGYALLATFPPNVRYVERFTDAQRSARAAGTGLWGACSYGG